MANYPKCPICGATGPIGADMPNCTCGPFEMDGARQRAVAWYEARADKFSGVLGIQFRNNAAKTRAGHSDHRLYAIIEAQAEYDRIT